MSPITSNKLILSGGIALVSSYVLSIVSNDYALKFDLALRLFKIMREDSTKIDDKCSLWIKHYNQINEAPGEGKEAFNYDVDLKLAAKRVHLCLEKIPEITEKIESSMSDVKYFNFMQTGAAIASDALTVCGIIVAISGLARKYLQRR